jgi:WAS/WASL-interacting protein
MNSAKPPPPPPHRPAASKPPPPPPIPSRPAAAHTPSQAPAHTPSHAPSVTPPPPPVSPSAVPSQPPAGGHAPSMAPPHAPPSTAPQAPSQAPPPVQTNGPVHAAYASGPSPHAETRFRVAVKLSARDPNLLLARPLREGEAAPPGTRAAYLLLVEAEGDTAKASHGGNGA